MIKIQMTANGFSLVATTEEDKIDLRAFQHRIGVSYQILNGNNDKVGVSQVDFVQTLNKTP
jgi:hypothetical protein